MHNGIIIVSLSPHHYLINVFIHSVKQFGSYTRGLFAMATLGLGNNY